MLRARLSLERLSLFEAWLGWAAIKQHSSLHAMMCGHHINLCGHHINLYFHHINLCGHHINYDIYSQKKKERMRIITLYKGHNRRNGKIEWRTWPMPIRKIAIWIQHETEFSWLRYKHFCLIISLLFHFFFFETKKACMWVCAYMGLVNPG